MKISVNVKPSSKENKIERMGNEFKIFVRASAIEGRANEVVIKLLAEYFDLSKSRIDIVLGLKSKKKVIEIR